MAKNTTREDTRTRISSVDIREIVTTLGVSVGQVEERKDSNRPAVSKQI
jgi:hypothetical protein